MNSKGKKKNAIFLNFVTIVKIYNCIQMSINPKNAKKS